MRFVDALNGDRPLVLDGGLSTWLGAKGHDLSDELWSARLLVEEPSAIVDAHLDFIRAGADVITTASYQATAQGFAKRGIDRAGFRAALHRSVQLAREAIDRADVDRPVYVAGSIGPYGAMLADGSEYEGNYGLTVKELVQFHRDRLLMLADAGPDVLALETVPDVLEADALLEALDGIGVPAWLSYTVEGTEEGIRTRAGQPLDDAFSRTAGITAIGVNCCEPRDVPGAMAVAAKAGLPTVAYPNSGEWSSSHRQPLAVWPGVQLIGGCCYTTPDDIAALSSGVS